VFGHKFREPFFQEVRLAVENPKHPQQSFVTAILSFEHISVSLSLLYFFYTLPREIEIKNY